MTLLSACVQAGHDSAYITLELRQPRHWNLKEAPHRQLLVFSTSCGSMKFLTIQFLFHEVSEPNMTRGILLSAGTQRSPVVWMLCTNPVSPTQTHTWINTIAGEDWLDYDWQVPEVLTGRMVLTITPYFKVACLSEHHPTHCWLTRISHICWPVVAQVTARLSHRIWASCSELWHCASPSVSQVIIGLEL